MYRKVLFDCSCLIYDKLSGIGVYSKNLYLALKKELQNDFICVLPIRKLKKKKNVYEHLGKVEIKALGFSKFNAIYHGPDYKINCSPFKITAVTIHDIAFFEDHILDPKFAKYQGKRVDYLLKFKRPNIIFTPSKFIKKQVIKRYPKYLDRVIVTPLGCDHLLTEYKKLSDKYHFLNDYGYFLFVGHLERRKNVINIIKAFELLKLDGLQHKLVIVGKDGFDALTIYKTIERSSFKRDIILPGFVTNEELAAFYSNASIFFYPSYYEGFGIPLIEAMKFKVPVVTSNYGTMDETVSDFAIKVNPFDPKSIAEGGKKALEIDRIFIQNALTYANSFTWEKTAKLTIEGYKKIIQNYEKTKLW